MSAFLQQHQHRGNTLAWKEQHDNDQQSVQHFLSAYLSRGFIIQQGTVSRGTTFTYHRHFHTKTVSTGVLWVFRAECEAEQVKSCIRCGERASSVPRTPMRTNQVRQQR